MGRLPVDIWAVSNVEVYGRHIEGNYVQYMCVLTCFFRPSEQEGSCCVWCGSPLSQFSDWDRLVLSRGELGCHSQMSSCV